MFRNRKYKSGTNWCAWRWTDTDSEYITRLHLLKTPLFAICLHWINKPDAEPYLHDHPVSFLSIILRGGYKEKRARFYNWRGIYGLDVSTFEIVKTNNWFNFILASKDDRHRIIEVKPNTLTLCLMGPKTREWGFYIENRWVYWKDYYAEKRRLENK